MVAAGNRGTIERTRAALEAFYTFLWPPEEDEARKRLLAILDEDLGGRPIDLLYDLAQELGVRASSLVLDAGCGQGNHSVQLAARFGCRVIALDPLDSNPSRTSRSTQNRTLLRRAVYSSCPEKQGLSKSCKYKPARPSQQVAERRN
jgi:hypothetical protein